MASAAQKAAFQKMLASKGKGKTTPAKDTPSPFDMKTGVDVGKGKKTIPAGKKPMAKIDIMLMKAMPGIGPKGVLSKKGGAAPMAKKSSPKDGKKGGKGGKPC